MWVPIILQIMLGVHCVTVLNNLLYSETKNNLPVRLNQIRGNSKFLKEFSQ